MGFLANTVIPLDDWIESLVNWLVLHWRSFFQGIKWPVDQLLNGITNVLQWPYELVVLGIFVLIAWRLAGWKVAAFTLVALGLLGGWNPILPSLDLWDLTMTTLAMIVTAVIICVILGVPVGIIAARSDRFESILRPILDTAQTTPVFVYLIPVAMLIGIGTVAGVIATIVFSIAPIIRLTNLGIREVDQEVIEAAYAFGSTPRQVLFEVQIPLALRTIMAGLNQTLMLALSMVVIASMIGAGGLGAPVRQGLNNLQPGIGFVGGIGVVLLAIVLDRISQSFGKR